YVQGMLMGKPSYNYELEFFASAGAGPFGRGEGQRRLSSAATRTDANGVSLFTFRLSGTIDPGAFVTATATDASSGETSEFSAPHFYGRPQVATTPHDQTVWAGQTVVLQA